MSNDHQMMRDQGNGFNLAIGEPFFLSDSLVWAQNIHTNGNYYYPLCQGDSELIDELQLLFPNKSIVITNGCKQAISAALYAFRDAGYREAYHPKPLWPSYFTLFKLAGFETAGTFQKNTSCLKVDTLINNPDGKEAKDSVDLLDCAYGHGVYGWDGFMPEHKVSVWSAAKLFGLSGLRVGWLITDDVEFAKKAALHVEITTSGVSVLSQRHIAKVLKYMRQHDITNSYKEARQTLMWNTDVFNQYIAPFCSVIKGASTEQKGMFTYFKATDENDFSIALSKASVKLVTGEACGEVESGWYRISMGHRHSFTVEALERLNKELNH